MNQKSSLLINLGVILVFGLTTIWSTAPNLFWPQLVFICLGLLFAYFLSRLDIRIFFEFSTSLYVLSIVLLLLTLVFGESVRGASRWLSFGPFNFQASEIVKPFLAIFLANFAGNKNLNYLPNLILYLLLAGIPTYLIKIQPDLGTALVVGALSGSILLFSNLSRTKIFAFLLLVLCLIPLSPYFLKSYQIDRLKTFLDPYHDPQGAGYNVIQSIIAIGSGGLLGKGVRLGTQSHLNFLPERHTDFVFASFAEEFGLLGMTLAILAYFFLMKRFLKLASDLNSDQPLKLLAMGIFAIFSFQIIVNIGMNLGLLPVTGITLPLFSYGGNSVLSSFILLGLTLGLLELVPKHHI